MNHPWAFASQSSSPHKIQIPYFFCASTRLRSPTYLSTTKCKPADCCQTKNMYSIATGQKLDSIRFVHLSDDYSVYFFIFFLLAWHPKRSWTVQVFRKVIVNFCAPNTITWPMPNEDTSELLVFFFLLWLACSLITFSQTSIRLTCDDECEQSKSESIKYKKKKKRSTIQSK